MSGKRKIEEFPDLGEKLGVLPKKSLFERQKAEAEAKRRREEEETAAVYQDFVKSFDDEDDIKPHPQRSSLGQASGPVSGRRHFTQNASGLPSKGKFGIFGPPKHGGVSVRESPQPPPSLARRQAVKALDDGRGDGTPASVEQSSRPVAPSSRPAFEDSDDEEQSPAPHHAQSKAVSKPILKMASLPPGVSVAAVQAMIPATLNVDGIRLITPPRQANNPGEVRSVTALVTLAQDTAAMDIDTVVNTLQNRYVGKGFYLSLSRHLSSASLHLDGHSGLKQASPSSSMPFGARPITLKQNFGRATGYGPHHGGYAPPSQFSASQGGKNTVQSEVSVNPPSDLSQLRMIHKTIESLIKYGPEFEALLMSRKEVQHEERWSWIWEARSAAGVYYRWRLWELLSGTALQGSKRVVKQPKQIFEHGAVWVAPEIRPCFEYTTRFSELVSDSDYCSSDDEDSGDERRKRFTARYGGNSLPDVQSLDSECQTYLNPLQKARLTHLLARLPTTSARLRRGDVGRITNFAIHHAGRGAEEVARMITSNISAPFAISSANPDRHLANLELSRRQCEEDKSMEPNLAPEDDPSSAKLVGLYVISDILSTSSTSGVRHAWRYRQLLEAQLARQAIFEHLGRLEKQLKWGKMRVEKWRRSVHHVLNLWEGWCVFSQSAQEHFTQVFDSPPLTAEEERLKKEAEMEEKQASKAKNRWKTVDDKTHEQNSDTSEMLRPSTPMEPAGNTPNIDGEHMDKDTDDVDGAPMLDDDDADDENVDGEAMVDSDEAENNSDEGAPLAEKGENLAPVEQISTNSETSNRRSALAESIAAKLDKATPQSRDGTSAHPSGSKDNVSKLSSVAEKKRQRPKAQDMFASDEE